MRVARIGTDWLWSRRLTLRRYEMVSVTQAATKAVPEYRQLYAGRRGTARVAREHTQHYALEAAVVIVPHEQEREHEASTA